MDAVYEAFEINKINLTKYLFFTGKGGVGKTSIACAVAVNLADSGKKVLLISTDPHQIYRIFLILSLMVKVCPSKAYPLW